MQRKGFTLMEIIVSLLIIATTMTAILATFVSVRRFNIRSKIRLQAANYARSLLEELRNEINASSWDSGRLNATSIWIDSPGQMPGGVGGLYNITRRYRVDNVTNRDYRKVTVEVGWSVPR